MTLREVHQRDEHDDCPVCQEKVRALVEAARQALPLLHICAGMTEESAEAAGIVVPALCAALAPFRGGQP